MSDIVEMLERLAATAQFKLVGDADVPLREAADEIKRLRAALRAMAGDDFDANDVQIYAQAVLDGKIITPELFEIKRWITREALGRDE